MTRRKTNDARKELESELILAQLRLVAQVRHTAALQSLISALKFDHTLPNVLDEAPHAYSQAVAIREEIDRLRGNLTEVGDRDYNIAIEERGAAQADADSLREEVERGRVWQAENAELRARLYGTGTAR